VTDRWSSRTGLALENVLELVFDAGSVADGLVTTGVETIVGFSIYVFPPVGVADCFPVDTAALPVGERMYWKPPRSRSHSV
jgi:hypothetical protein